MSINHFNLKVTFSYGSLNVKMKNFSRILKSVSKPLRKKLTSRHPSGRRWNSILKPKGFLNLLILPTNYKSNLFSYYWKNQSESGAWIKPKTVLLKPSYVSHVSESYLPGMETKYFERIFDKNRLKHFVRWFFKTWGIKRSLRVLEILKALGFQYAHNSGLSLNLEDLYVPSKKKYLRTLNEIQFLQQEFQVFENAMLDKAYSVKFIGSWSIMNQILRNAFLYYFKTRVLLPRWFPTNVPANGPTEYFLDRPPSQALLRPLRSDSLYIMAFSGARGNMSQVSQLTLMRGLMSDPSGKLVEFPIISNFREGLNLTEYLISCYGARKGIIDTGLRTAVAGDFTRRLVDVGHRMVIKLRDCETRQGIYLNDLTLSKSQKTLLSLEKRLKGRILANNSRIVPQYRNKEINLTFFLPKFKQWQSSPQTFSSNPVINTVFTHQEIREEILVRSPLTCSGEGNRKARTSMSYLCRYCYGWNIRGQIVDLGEAVGVLAGQSLGEPGTQLTLRTFHTGGVYTETTSKFQIVVPFQGHLVLPNYATIKQIFNTKKKIKTMITWPNQLNSTGSGIAKFRSWLQAKSKATPVEEFTLLKPAFNFFKYVKACQLLQLKMGHQAPSTEAKQIFYTKPSESGKNSTLETVERPVLVTAKIEKRRQAWRSVYFSKYLKKTPLDHLLYEPSMEIVPLAQFETSLTNLSGVSKFPSFQSSNFSEFRHTLANQAETNFESEATLTKLPSEAGLNNSLTSNLIPLGIDLNRLTLPFTLINKPAYDLFLQDFYQPLLFSGFGLHQSVTYAHHKAKKPLSLKVSPSSKLERFSYYRQSILKSLFKSLSPTSFLCKLVNLEKSTEQPEVFTSKEFADQALNVVKKDTQIEKKQFSRFISEHTQKNSALRSPLVNHSPTPKKLPRLSPEVFFEFISKLSNAPFWQQKLEQNVLNSKVNLELLKTYTRYSRSFLPFLDKKTSFLSVGSTQQAKAFLTPFMAGQTKVLEKLTWPTSTQDCQSLSTKKFDWTNFSFSPFDKAITMNTISTELWEFPLMVRTLPYLDYSLPPSYFAKTLEIKQKLAVFQESLKEEVFKDQILGLVPSLGSQFDWLGWESMMTFSRYFHSHFYGIASQLYYRTLKILKFKSPNYKRFCQKWLENQAERATRQIALVNPPTPLTQPTQVNGFIKSALFLNASHLVPNWKLQSQDNDLNRFLVPPTKFNWFRSFFLKQKEMITFKDFLSRHFNNSSPSKFYGYFFQKCFTIFLVKKEYNYKRDQQKQKLKNLRKMVTMHTLVKVLQQNYQQPMVPITKEPINFASIQALEINRQHEKNFHPFFYYFNTHYQFLLDWLSRYNEEKKAYKANEEIKDLYRFTHELLNISPDLKFSNDSHYRIYNEYLLNFNPRQRFKKSPSAWLALKGKNQFGKTSWNSIWPPNFLKNDLREEMEEIQRNIRELDPLKQLARETSTKSISAAPEASPFSPVSKLYPSKLPQVDYQIHHFAFQPERSHEVIFSLDGSGLLKKGAILVELKAKIKNLVRRRQNYFFLCLPLPLRQGVFSREIPHLLPPSSENFRWSSFLEAKLKVAACYFVYDTSLAPLKLGHMYFTRAKLPLFKVLPLQTFSPSQSDLKRLLFKRILKPRFQARYKTAKQNVLANNLRQTSRPLKLLTRFKPTSFSVANYATFYFTKKFCFHTSHRASQTFSVSKWLECLTILDNTVKHGYDYRWSWLKYRFHPIAWLWQMLHVYLEGKLKEDFYPKQSFLVSNFRYVFKKKYLGKLSAFKLYYSELDHLVFTIFSSFSVKSLELSWSLPLNDCKAIFLRLPTGNFSSRCSVKLPQIFQTHEKPFTKQSQNNLKTSFLKKNSNHWVLSSSEKKTSLLSAGKVLWYALVSAGSGQQSDYAAPAKAGFASFSQISHVKFPPLSSPLTSFSASDRFLSQSSFLPALVLENQAWLNHKNQVFFSKDNFLNANLKTQLGKKKVNPLFYQKPVTSRWFYHSVLRLNLPTWADQWQGYQSFKNPRPTDSGQLLKKNSHGWLESTALGHSTALFNQFFIFSEFNVPSAIFELSFYFYSFFCTMVHTDRPFLNLKKWRDTILKKQTFPPSSETLSWVPMNKAKLFQPILNEVNQSPLVTESPFFQSKDLPFSESEWFRSEYYDDAENTPIEDQANFTFDAFSFENIKNIFKELSLPEFLLDSLSLKKNREINHLICAQFFFTLHFFPLQLLNCIIPLLNSKTTIYQFYLRTFYQAEDVLNDPNPNRLRLIKAKKKKKKRLSAFLAPNLPEKKNYFGITDPQFFFNDLQRIGFEQNFSTLIPNSIRELNQNSPLYLLNQPSPAYELSKRRFLAYKNHHRMHHFNELKNRQGTILVMTEIGFLKLASTVNTSFLVANFSRVSQTFFKNKNWFVRQKTNSFTKAFHDKSSWLPSLPKSVIKTSKPLLLQPTFTGSTLRHLVWLNSKFFNFKVRASFSRLVNQFFPNLGLIFKPTFFKRGVPWVCDSMPLYAFHFSKFKQSTKKFSKNKNQAATFFPTLSLLSLKRRAFLRNFSRWSSTFAILFTFKTSLAWNFSTFTLKFPFQKTPFQYKLRSKGVKPVKTKNVKLVSLQLSTIFAKCLKSTQIVRTLVNKKQPNLLQTNLKTGFHETYLFKGGLAYHLFLKKSASFSLSTKKNISETLTPSEFSWGLAFDTTQSLFIRYLYEIKRSTSATYKWLPWEATNLDHNYSHFKRFESSSYPWLASNLTKRFQYAPASRDSNLVNQPERLPEAMLKPNRIPSLLFSEFYSEPLFCLKSLTLNIELKNRAFLVAPLNALNGSTVLPSILKAENLYQVPPKSLPSTLEAVNYEQIFYFKYVWSFTPLKFARLMDKNPSPLRVSKYDNQSSFRSKVSLKSYHYLALTKMQQANQARFKKVTPKSKLARQNSTSLSLNLHQVSFDSLYFSTFAQIYFIQNITSFLHWQETEDTLQGVHLLRRYFDLTNDSSFHLLLRETFDRLNPYIYRRFKDFPHKTKEASWTWNSDLSFMSPKFPKSCLATPVTVKEKWTNYLSKLSSSLVRKQKRKPKCLDKTKRSTRSSNTRHLLSYLQTNFGSKKGLAKFPSSLTYPWQPLLKKFGWSIFLPKASSKQLTGKLDQPLSLSNFQRFALKKKFYWSKQGRFMDSRYRTRFKKRSFQIMLNLLQTKLNYKAKASDQGSGQFKLRSNLFKVSPWLAGAPFSYLNSSVTWLLSLDMVNFLKKNPSFIREPSISFKAPRQTYWYSFFFVNVPALRWNIPKLKPFNNRLPRDEDHFQFKLSNFNAGKIKEKKSLPSQTFRPKLNKTNPLSFKKFAPSILNQPVLKKKFTPLLLPTPKRAVFSISLPKLSEQKDAQLQQLTLQTSLVKILQQIVNHVQAIYNQQGVDLYDQHIEVLARQMGSKIQIEEDITSKFLWNEIIPMNALNNRPKLYPINFKPLVSGITKVSLQSDSFLSAASFQSSTQILSQAALRYRTDFLIGLKENVIVRNFIPNGTGIFQNNRVKIESLPYPIEKKNAWFDLVAIRKNFPEYLDKNPWLKNPSLFKKILLLKAFRSSIYKLKSSVRRKKFSKKKKNS